MKQYIGVVVVVLALSIVGLFGADEAWGEVLNSPNYSIPESYIGPGGANDSSSTNYRGTDTIGDISTGATSSTNYQAATGFKTTDEPRLSVVVGTSSVSFGNFSTASTITRTATFNVLNYTAYGYSVYIIGSPPSSSSHTLTAMSSTAASAAGNEQFGINLKANTSPTAFGADPVQVPSGVFSFGAAASGYNTANQYRYVNGEKIAESVKTSGETDYTISYIVNAATTTPAGSYSGAQQIVVVGTY